MPYFLRLNSSQVINLDLVPRVYSTRSAGCSGKLTAVVIEFVGGQEEVIYEDTPGYRDLLDWMDQQPNLGEPVKQPTFKEGS